MNKTLRTMFACMLMMFGMTAMAEDIIWSEDFSAVTDVNANPATLYPNYTFTGTVLKDDGTVQSGTKFYNEKSAGGTAPELLIAKGGGSFAATIALNGKSGEMTLSYQANYDRITVTAESATLGEKTKSGNNYTIPVTVAQGTTSIKLIFTNSNSSNVRFDDAKLYQGVAKKNAGLSWGTASRSVTIGSESNVFPTLSNDNQLTVTYSSSVEAVATINAEGTITLVAAGETVISAAFAGNDSFEAQTVSYTLTVKEAEQPVDPTPGEVKTVTIAQFNAAEVSDEVWYQLTGTVKNLKDDDQYGNFDLEDETGSVYVYGLLSEKGGEKKQFQTLATEKGIKNGSKLTIIGTRGYYAKDDKIEVMNAYFVSVENGGEQPVDPVEFEGDGTKDNPYTVADLKKMTLTETAETAWVKGFIVGTLASSSKFDTEYKASNIAIAASADETEATNTIPVELKSGSDARKDINLVDNAANLGKLVKVHGTITAYFGVNGVKDLDDYVIEGTTAIQSIATESKAEVYNLQGQRVEKAVKGLYIINGKKVLVK